MKTRTFTFAVVLLIATTTLAEAGFSSGRSGGSFSSSRSSSYSSRSYSSPSRTYTAPKASAPKPSYKAPASKPKDTTTYRPTTPHTTVVNNYNNSSGLSSWLPWVGLWWYASQDDATAQASVDSVPAVQDNEAPVGPPAPEIVTDGQCMLPEFSK